MIQISLIVVGIKLLFKKIYNYQILYLEKIKEKKNIKQSRVLEGTTNTNFFLYEYRH